MSEERTICDFGLSYDYCGSTTPKLTHTSILAMKYVLVTLRSAKAHCTKFYCKVFCRIDFCCFSFHARCVRSSWMDLGFKICWRKNYIDSA